ncbi:hypothetical protein KKC59_02525, partial [bacterium]|nr:hypothetical protein [bacterium]
PIIDYYIKSIDTKSYAVIYGKMQHDYSVIYELGEIYLNGKINDSQRKKIIDFFLVCLNKKIDNNDMNYEQVRKAVMDVCARLNPEDKKEIMNVLFAAFGQYVDGYFGTYYISAAIQALNGAEEEIRKEAQKIIEQRQLTNDIEICLYALGAGMRSDKIKEGFIDKLKASSFDSDLVDIFVDIRSEYQEEIIGFIVDELKQSNVSLRGKQNLYGFIEKILSDKRIDEKIQIDKGKEVINSIFKDLEQNKDSFVFITNAIKTLKEIGVKERLEEKDSKIIFLTNMLSE